MLSYSCAYPTVFLTYVYLLIYRQIHREDTHICTCVHTHMHVQSHTEILHGWFTLKMNAIAASGPGQKYRPETPAKSLMWLTGVHAFGPSSAIFSGMIAGCWIRSEAARTSKCTLKGCQCWRQCCPSKWTF